VPALLALAALAMPAVLALAAVLRLLGARGDLWMDEIWSLQVLQGVTSPLDFFLVKHEDANHILNSLIFHAMGEGTSDFAYRLPAVAAGVASVWLAARLVAHRGRLDSIVAALFVAVSYVTVHFGSEARGYSLMGFFVLLSMAGVQRLSGEELRFRDALLLWTSLILGVLAHLTFLLFQAALMLWSAAMLLEQRGTREATRTWLVWHAVPLAFLGVLWSVHLRWLVRGEGPDLPYLEVVARALSVTAGGPSDPPASLFAAALVAILGGLTVWRLRGDPKLPAGLFGLAIAGAPAALLVFAQPTAIAVRYFYASSLLLLVVLSTGVADGLRARGGWRALTGGLVALFLAGNAWHVSLLFRYHRGEPRAVLQYVADHSSGEAIRLGSDHDLRLMLLLTHYGPQVEAESGRHFVYRERRYRPPEGLEWILVTRPGRTPPSITDRHGNPYRLVHESPRALLSGTRWQVFRSTRQVD
jgi:hypothetical protein